MIDTCLPLSAADVRAALERIRPGIHRTPVITSSSLDRRLGVQVFLKCENLQRTGSFKMRGALNAISNLSIEERRRGVIAYSSGNHAQALALAASSAGSRAVILMPIDAPVSKIEATKGYGAEVIHYDRYSDDRFALCAAIARERGLVEIPPCEHYDVMAGQGTVALELMQEVPELDSLLVQVGGGGLIAGCSVAAKSLRPSIRVIGVEPEESDDAKRSLEQGRRVSIPMPHTIADGQASGGLGEKTYDVISRLVDDVLLVNRSDIVTAMTWMFERLKVVAEPSGATALAALIKNAHRFKGEKVGVVISGGNVTADRFSSLTQDAGKSE